MDRALASEASCWGFKSLQARQLQEYSGLEESSGYETATRRSSE